MVKPRIVSLPVFFLTMVTSCFSVIVRILGPVIRLPELKSARDGFPDVRIEFSVHLDHDLVFSTRCAFPESKRNLPDSLTISRRKGMKGFPRPSLLDSLRYFCVRWFCEEFFEVFVHNVSATLQMFHFLRPPRFINPFQDRSSGLWWWTFQTRWRSQLCRFFAPKNRLFPCHIFRRALCSAMDRFLRFTASFSRLRSKHSLRTSIIMSSCGSR